MGTRMKNSPEGEPTVPAPPATERTSVFQDETLRGQETDQAFETDLTFQTAATSGEGFQ
jgi:hypothetical protein